MTTRKQHHPERAPPCRNLSFPKRAESQNRKWSFASPINHFKTIRLFGLAECVYLSVRWDAPVSNAAKHDSALAPLRPLRSRKFKIGEGRDPLVPFGPLTPKAWRRRRRRRRGGNSSSGGRRGAQYPGIEIERKRFRKTFFCLNKLWLLKYFSQVQEELPSRKGGRRHTDFLLKADIMSFYCFSLALSSCLISLSSSSFPPMPEVMSHIFYYIYI